MLMQRGLLGGGGGRLQSLVEQTVAFIELSEPVGPCGEGVPHL